MNRQIDKALIVGNHVTSLNILRSLGSKGIQSYLTHKDNLCISKYSKYCKGFFKCPPFVKEKELLEYLIYLAEYKGMRNSVLMPTNDDTVSVLSKNKTILDEFYIVPVPRWEIINRAYDKRITLKIAEANNIPYPKAVFPRNINEMKERIGELVFPLVIKPAMGKKYYFNSGVKMHFANNITEAEFYFAKIASVMGEENIIVQEYIPGDMSLLYNYAAVFKDGQPYGIFTGRKIRQHPRDFGVGTAAKTVNDPELTRLGTLLLHACEYEGIGYIEFKKDLRDNKFKLIEINPRHWNFVDLAVHCGVDLPYNLYLYATNQEIPTGHTSGEVSWFHFWTDFGETIKHFMKGEESLIEFIKSYKGEKKFAVFDKTDWKPFVMETLIIPYLIFKR